MKPWQWRSVPSDNYEFHGMQGFPSDNGRAS